MVEKVDRLTQETTRLMEDNKRVSNECMIWKENYYTILNENIILRESVSELMDKVQELQEYKEKIEKLPEYESWVAGFNCGGYHG